MAKKFGADIGYNKVRIILPGSSDVLSENAVIGVSVSDNLPVAIGDEAVALFERVPGSIKLIRPFSGEMMPEEQYVTAYFSYAIKKLKMRGASLLLSFSGAHDEQTESLYVKAIQKAGVGSVSVVDALYAAAQGCDVLGVGDSAVVNIGASVTDMGCFSRGKQVAAASNSFAGNAFDRAIISETIKRHRYRPSQEEAERIKKELVDLREASGKTSSVNVIRPAMGLPKKITLTDTEVSGACESVFENLADEIVAMIRTLKAEPDKIILTGGSAHLKGLASAFAPLLLLPIEIASEPENAVIRGVGSMLDRI